MDFEPKKIKYTRPQRQMKHKRTPEEQEEFNEQMKQYLIYGAYAFAIIVILGSLFIYNKYIRTLPDIKEIENQKIPEASTIYDRNGKEIYSIYYGEKRTYINYDEISKNMVNAIVSTEDNTFFENSGFDIKGIFRSIFNYVLHRTDKIEGTSTISQQLIKNMMLTNERSLERKIKELRLSYKLNANYSKEKILELYLNKIAYGSNAYGIEQASRTFFGKSAKDLGILESSILASLPKGPTYYNPYNHYDRLVGYPYIYDKETPDDTTKLIEKKDLDANSIFVNKFKDLISSLSEKRLTDDKMQLCGIKNKYLKKSISLDSNNCTIIAYSDLMSFLNNIQIKGSILDGTIETQKDLVFEYQTGRKDFVLQRMLEDKKISFTDYKAAFINSIGMTFSATKEDIKYPHFVMYVKEYLEKKYGKGIMENGGFKIYTTLDSSLQDKAQELVEKQVATNKNIGASNAAMISIDNRNGGILAMIGGANYFDKENAGNVNVITSKRQVGSTMKPLIYSLAIKNNVIGTKTPIYDLKTTFPGDYEPNNYDGKFIGKMDIMTALNYSRNIPAIKMYFLAGQQGPIINYLESLGINSLDRNFYYGAPLGIGAAEIEPIELVQAYSVFANMGNKKEITPILKILDSKGNTIEALDTNVTGKQVIDPKLAYIMNYILSASETRPNDFWNRYLTLSDRKVCAKTGTSNKMYMKNGKKTILPGDIWTAGYTPQITTVVWGGNNDGSPLGAKGDGIAGAGPIWKGFMEYAHKNLTKTDWQKPDDLKMYYISKMSGYLSSDSTGSGASVGAYFYNEPKKYDTGSKAIQVDALCNGKVTRDTPPEAVKTVYISQINDVDPTRTEWQNAAISWAKNGGLISGDFVSNYTDEVCERNSDSSAAFDINANLVGSDILKIGTNTVSVKYSSNTPIIRADIYAGTTKVKSETIDKQKSGDLKIDFEIDNTSVGASSLKIVLVDENYYSGNKSIIFDSMGASDTNTTTTNQDTNNNTSASLPSINIKNPSSGSIKIFEDQSFNLRFETSDSAGISSINIYLDGKALNMNLEAGTNVVPININNDIPVGNHTITVEAVNNNFSKASKDINCEILAR